jgi:hypothetical protein
VSRWRLKSLWFGIIGATTGLASSCQSERHPPPANADQASAPSDSLILSNEGGVEVWFTLARTAHASDGTECVERGLEIRRGSTRVPVPLLYTGERPTLVNDSTVRAVLWNHCQPLAPYLVDLRTGRPVPQKGGNRS